MTVAITAAGQASSALLTVTGLTVGTDATLTIQRSWAGQVGNVRGATNVPVTGDTMVFTDYECPFVPASFAVTTYGSDGSVGSQASSSAVTLTSDRPVISDPLNPRTACAVRFHGDALTQVDYVQPGDLPQPLGSAYPVAVVGTRAVGGGIPLDLLCMTWQDRNDVLAVFESAAVVCLRCPPLDRYALLPPLCYVTAPTVSEMPLNVQRSGPSRIAWTGQLVRAPATPIAAPVRTCADLLTEAATCADLLTLYDTCNELLLGG